MFGSKHTISAFDYIREKAICEGYGVSLDLPAENTGLNPF
jgi:hypothetical protein